MSFILILIFSLNVQAEMIGGNLLPCDSFFSKIKNFVSNSDNKLIELTDAKIVSNNLSFSKTKVISREDVQLKLRWRDIWRRSEDFNDSWLSVSSHETSQGHHSLVAKKIGNKNVTIENDILKDEIVMTLKVENQNGITDSLVLNGHRNDAIGGVAEDISRNGKRFDRDHHYLLEAITLSASEEVLIIKKATSLVDKTSSSSGTSGVTLIFIAEGKTVIHEVDFTQLIEIPEEISVVPGVGVYIKESLNTKGKLVLKPGFSLKDIN